VITSSGAVCDVCGKYILPVQPGEMVNNFAIVGILNTLHCDNACRGLVERAMKTKDWKLLPHGPLRGVFEKQAAEDTVSAGLQPTTGQVSA
jgi:hypothetical protein